MSSIEQQVIQIVESALSTSSGADMKGQLQPSDSMESITEWDSLSLISIYMSINESFSILADPDDAIHYTSIQSITSFVSDQLDQANS